MRRPYEDDGVMVRFDGYIEEERRVGKVEEVGKEYMSRAQSGIETYFFASIVRLRPNFPPVSKKGV